MEASNISWIVYELVRVKDDRNSMKHEDVLGHYQAKILELRSKNRRLNFQLKDLYGKYERAMRCDGFGVEENISASSVTKVPSLEVSNQIETFLKKEPIRTKRNISEILVTNLDVCLKEGDGSNSKSRTKTAADVGTSDNNITGKRRVMDDFDRGKSADKEKLKTFSSVEGLIPIASSEGIGTSARRVTAKCKAASGSEGIICFSNTVCLHFNCL